MYIIHIVLSDSVPFYALHFGRDPRHLILHYIVHCRISF